MGEVLATKPNNQSSIPGTYVVEGENSCKLSSDLHIYMVACMHPHTYAQNKEKCNFKKGFIMLAMVAHTFKPSTWEAEAGR